jgi:hypothetical protein
MHAHPVTRCIDCNAGAANTQDKRIEFGKFERRVRRYMRNGKGPDESARTLGLQTGLHLLRLLLGLIDLALLRFLVGYHPFCCRI